MLSFFYLCIVKYAALLSSLLHNKTSYEVIKKETSDEWVYNFASVWSVWSVMKMRYHGHKNKPYLNWPNKNER